MQIRPGRAKIRIAGCLIAALVFRAAAVLAAPPAFLDDAGRPVRLLSPPQRVVSLVPSITEIIFALGAGDLVRAVTIHDTWPPEAAVLPAVGGFFAPDPDRVADLGPDLVFVSALQQAIVERFAGSDVQLVDLETDSIEDSFDTIRRLGQIFDKAAAAERLVGRIRADLALVAAKVARIPAGERLRVMRLMGRDRVMTPGDDSFQNEMIRAAGGIPPSLGKTGPVVEVTLDEWRRFNPQAVYGCGGDRQAAAALFDRPGWREVDAVKNGRVIYFPCALTCRCATHTGEFAGWLASRLYAGNFARKENQVHPDGAFDRQPLTLDLPCVTRAHIVRSRIHDFVNKSLVIDLAEPMAVVSTLEGQRQGVRTVGNHSSPPPCWAVGHAEGLDAVRRKVFRALALDSADCAFLFTGADMDHLSVQRRSHREMTVVALVTAGAESNAQRMSRDTGSWYEPGTINVLVLTNTRLSPRAMTRAVITATEAKTAALDDLDVRSSYRPAYGATGTGTDNVMVVQGIGTPIDNAGGHSKMGELIAAAVHAGVTEALFQQNGLTARRHVLRRLAERRLGLWERVAAASCDCRMPPGRRVAAVERLLLEDRYAGFLEAAMALSDARTAGRTTDLTAFADWCRQVASEIAGRPVAMDLAPLCGQEGPKPVEMALDAMITGAGQRGCARENGS